MAKKITGKVNFVGSDAVLINAGRKDGRSVSVPLTSFKGNVPEKYQKLDFEVDAVGPKVKKSKDGSVVFRSKSAYVANFRLIKLWDTDMVIEDEDVAGEEYEGAF